MKDWIKYIVSTIIFFTIYTVFQWLFDKTIDWEITIIATIIYAVINTISHIVLNKVIK